MQVAKKNPAKTAAIAKAIAVSKAKKSKSNSDHKHHAEHKHNSEHKHHSGHKINNTAEYKKAVKASKHFLRQLTMFNGFSAKLSKTKLGDKKMLLNARSSMNKMSKLWEEYEKACGKLHSIEKNFASPSKKAVQSDAKKKTTAKKPGAKKTTAKKTTAKKATTKKPGPKKTAAKKSNVVKMTKKPAQKTNSN